MGLFSRRKAAKDEKDSRAERPKAAIKFAPYVPRYAVRDALQCSPISWKEDNAEAFRRAHLARAARDQDAICIGGWSNPKSPRISMSRNSSALSLNMIPDTSRPPAPRRHTLTAGHGLGSASASYQSMTGLASFDVPVPSIPAQYASMPTSPIAGPSTRRTPSRRSSLNPQLHSYYGQLQSMPVSSPMVRPASFIRERPPYVRNAPSGLKNVATHDFVSHHLPSPVRTPVDSRAVSPVEKRDSGPLNSIHSSSGSTSSGSSRDAFEMATRREMPRAATITPDSSTMSVLPSHYTDRVYPADPHRLAEAPADSVEEPAPPSRQYFSHPPSPVSPASAAPPAKGRRFSLMRRSKHVDVTAH